MDSVGFKNKDVACALENRKSIPVSSGNRLGLISLDSKTVDVMQYW